MRVQQSERRKIDDTVGGRMTARLDGTAVAENAYHSPNHSACSHRRIAGGTESPRVITCWAKCAGCDARSAFLPGVEDNLPRLKFGEGAMLDGNHIAGPESRQHAGPVTLRRTRRRCERLRPPTRSILRDAVFLHPWRQKPTKSSGCAGRPLVPAPCRRTAPASRDVLAAHVRLLVVLLDDLLAFGR